MYDPLPTTPESQAVVIGGLQKSSLTDYPGKTCAVIFTRGCDYRCRYCHNPALVLPERFTKLLPIEEVCGFLERRRGKLDAVTVSGGEPTLHAGLPALLARIREMDFLVKLDTNGSRPKALGRIIKAHLVDYIAMDIKAPLGKYEAITGCWTDTKAVEESIALIVNSGIEYEFRTTVVRELTSKDDLHEIAGRMIRGARRYSLQQFVPSVTLSAEIGNGTRYSDHELQELAKELSAYVGRCSVR